MLFLKDIIKNLYALARRLPEKLRPKQVEILMTYIVVIFAYIVDSIISKKYLHQRVIFGYKVNYFQPNHLLNIFTSNFIQNDYYFSTRKLKPVIIDAGANIGDSVLYFKWLYPKSKIIAFEASPSTFQLLKKNVEQNNLSNISLHNVALAGNDGVAKFYKDEKNPGSGLESLYDSSEKYRNRNKDFVKINKVRLSHYINSPVDFLKLDVEGAEKEILPEIAEKGKLKWVKQIIIEYHHHLTNSDNQLSIVLGILENSGFSYQLSTPLFPPFKIEIFQDILIFGYRQS